MKQGVEYLVTINGNYRNKFKQINRGFDKANRKVQQLNSHINRMSVAFVALGAVAAYGIITMGRSIVDTTAEFQKFEAVLTNTFNSNSEALESMALIQDFAAKTPFQVDRLTESYVKLVNRGFKPTEDELTKLGDLASSTAKPFDQLVEAILDAETGEFERLKEFGIKAKQSGSKVTFAFKGVTKTVDKSNEAIRAYVLSLGELQGVQGAMAAISKTLGGQISNLQDTMTQLQLKIGQKLAPGISRFIILFGELVDEASDNIDIFDILNSKLEDFAIWTREAIKWGKENWSTIKMVGEMVLSAVEAWVLLATTIKLASAAMAIFDAMQAGNILGLFSILVADIIYLNNTSQKFHDLLSDIWEIIKTIGTNIKQFFTDPIILMVRSITPFLEAMENISNGDFNKAKDNIAAGIGNIATLGLGAGTSDTVSRNKKERANRDAQRHEDIERKKFDDHLDRIMKKAKAADEAKAARILAEENAKLFGGGGGSSTNKSSKIGTGGFSASGSGKGGNVTLTINKLIETVNIKSNADWKILEQQLKITLLGALNDVTTQTN